MQKTSHVLLAACLCAAVPASALDGCVVFEHWTSATPPYVGKGLNPFNREGEGGLRKVRMKTGGRGRSGGAGLAPR